MNLTIRIVDAASPKTTVLMVTRNNITAAQQDVALRALAIAYPNYVPKKITVPGEITMAFPAERLDETGKLMIENLLQGIVFAL
jgi:hypothetical protein